MESAFAYSGKTVTINGEDYDVPEFSKWEEKCKCGPFHIAYFPSINSYFCNQWECSFLYPAIIIALTTITFASGEWSLVYTTSGAATIILCVLGALVYLIWWAAYLQSMCRSAGYLPWFWYVEKREQYTYEEHMAGIITNSEQMDFARNVDKPERSVLSQKAKRIVLRADHICKWIGNWVGLKNYRFFFIQLVWFVMLFIFFFIVCALEIADMARHGWHTYPPRILIFIVFIPVMLFFIFFMVVFLRHARYLVTNNTTVHELKSQQSGDFTNPYDLGCWQNCVETMGPAKYCPIWFLPCPIPRSNDGFTWRRNDTDPIDDQKDDEPVNDVESSPQPVTTEFYIGNTTYQESDSPDQNKKRVIPEIPQSQKNDDEEIMIFTEPGDNDEMIIPAQSMITRMPAPPRASNEENKTNKKPRKKRPEITFESTTASKKDNILDTLIDKTLDGEDDEDFDAYTKGEKVAPVPPKKPVNLKIKTTKVRRRVSKKNSKVNTIDNEKHKKREGVDALINNKHHGVRGSQTLGNLPVMQKPERKNSEKGRIPKNQSRADTRIAKQESKANIRLERSNKIEHQESKAQNIRLEKKESKANGLKLEKSNSRSGGIKLDKTESKANGLRLDKTESKANGLKLDKTESKANGLKLDKTESKASGLRLEKTQQIEKKESKAGSVRPQKKESKVGGNKPKMEKSGH